MVVESAPRHVTFLEFIVKINTLVKLFFVSMRCEIIPGMYIHTYLSTNMMQVH
jgi:hypothetical protein